MWKIEYWKRYRFHKKMVLDSSKTLVIYVYPQNSKYRYNEMEFGYCDEMEIKDIFNDNDIYETFFFKNIGIRSYPNVIYEPTKTKIGDIIYDADFHFTNMDEKLVKTKSDLSAKATTIQWVSYMYTTLNICSSNENIKNFIDILFDERIDNEIPKWVKEYSFLNDEKIKKLIQETEKRISMLEKSTEEAKNS